jgi:hypothetical protein
MHPTSHDRQNSYSDHGEMGEHGVWRNKKKIKVLSAEAGPFGDEARVMFEVRYLEVLGSVVVPGHSTVRMDEIVGGRDWRHCFACQDPYGRSANGAWQLRQEILTPGRFFNVLRNSLRMRFECRDVLYSMSIDFEPESIST